MSNNHPLDQVGTVLIKAASYIELLEEENRQLKQAQTEQIEAARMNEAKKLAKKYAQATGKEIDVNTVKKIAASPDEDIKALFNKLASFEDADELGGVHSTKSAGSDSLAPEDQRLLNWIASS